MKLTACNECDEVIDLTHAPKGKQFKIYVCALCAQKIERTMKQKFAKEQLLLVKGNDGKEHVYNDDTLVRVSSYTNDEHKRYTVYPVSDPSKRQVIRECNLIAV